MLMHGWKQAQFADDITFDVFRFMRDHENTDGQQGLSDGGYGDDVGSPAEAFAS